MELRFDASSIHDSVARHKDVQNPTVRPSSKFERDFSTLRTLGESVVRRDHERLTFLEEILEQMMLKQVSAEFGMNLTVSN